MINIADGKATAIPAIDSSESSLSPPHSTEYPKGSFIASISGFILAIIESAFFPNLTSLIAVIILLLSLWIMILSSKTVSSSVKTVPNGTDLFIVGDQTRSELKSEILLRSSGLKAAVIAKDLSPSLNAPIVAPVVAICIDIFIRGRPRPKFCIWSLRIFGRMTSTRSRQSVLLNWDAPSRSMISRACFASRLKVSGSFP